jgi:non-homologous end joining protein Ku
MAQRSSWAGPITFGGFPFAVKAYPLLAGETKDKRIKTLCTCHNAPVKAPRVCGVSGATLTDAEQIKGVEKSKNAFAVVDGAALDAASGPKSVAIAPTRVVHLTTVPLYLTMAAYRFVPEPGHEASVAGLQAVLEKSGKALEVPGFVARNGAPDTVLILFGRDGELLGCTIADKTKLHARPALTATLLPDAQLAMLGQVLDTVYPLGDFDATSFESQHAAKRAGAILAAVAGTAVAAPTDAAPAAPAVPDLMAALEASLKAAAQPTKEPTAA